MSEQRSNWGESKAGGNTLLAQLGFADRDRANPRHDLACAYAASRALDLAQMLTPSGKHALKIAPRSESPEYYRPQLRCELECPITKSNGYLVGFADGVLTWTYSQEPDSPVFRDHTLRALHASKALEQLKEWTYWQGLRLTAHLAEQTITADSLAPLTQEIADKLSTPTMFEHVFRAFCEVQKRVDGDTAKLKSRDQLYVEFITDVARNAERHLAAVRDSFVSASTIIEVKISRVDVGSIVRQIEAYRIGSATIAGHEVSLRDQPALLIVDFDLMSTDVETLRSKGIRPLRLGPKFDQFIASGSHKVEVDEL